MFGKKFFLFYNLVNNFITKTNTQVRIRIKSLQQTRASNSS